MDACCYSAHFHSPGSQSHPQLTCSSMVDFGAHQEDNTNHQTGLANNTHILRVLYFSEWYSDLTTGLHGWAPGHGRDNRGMKMIPEVVYFGACASECVCTARPCPGFLRLHIQTWLSLSNHSPKSCTAQMTKGSLTSRSKAWVRPLGPAGCPHSPGLCFPQLLLIHSFETAQSRLCAGKAICYLSQCHRHGDSAQV